MTTRACPTCGATMPGNAPEALCPRCLLRVAMTGPDHGGASFAPPTPAQLAPLFPHLEILELIGQGGMGAVYKARQIKLDRFVALKILPRQADRDPAFGERFLREARALARLQHPNIVTVHDFGEADDLYFFVMEYVDGVNLRQLMKSGPLDPAQALKIVPVICDALQYAHQNEIVHRDVKPENILLDRAGRVKIADFGLAKLVGRTPADFTLTGTKQAMGTPHYMAPEQMSKPLSVDHRADIYSLGVVFYELLTGELPVGRFPPPSQKVQIDVRLDEVVLKALERDPERRYQTVAEVATAVEEATSDLESPPAAEERGQLDSTNEWLAMVVLLVGAVAIIFGIVQVKTGWIAFGLIALQQIAKAITWRADRRPLVGQILVLAGIGASVAILVSAISHWWVIFMIWWWYGEDVFKFFKKSKEGAEVEENEEDEEDEEDEELDEDDAVIVAALEKFKKHGVMLAPDIDPDAQHQIRIDCKVPPDERAVGLWVLPVTTDDTFAVLFTNAAVHFLSEKGEDVISTKTLAYDEFDDNPFVNHGRSVYLGDGQSVTPHPGQATYCQTLCDMLNAVRKTQ